MNTTVRVGAMLSGVLAVMTSVGCGARPQTHVRFARAAPEEIHTAESSGEVVWYDFEPGDEVPMAFGLLGVAEAVTETPVRFIAQRPFSIVVFPNGDTLFSFDGHSLMSGMYAARWSIALGAGPEGGRAAILLYVGNPNDVPADLRR